MRSCWVKMAEGEGTQRKKWKVSCSYTRAPRSLFRAEFNILGKLKYCLWHEGVYRLFHIFFPNCGILLGKEAYIGSLANKSLQLVWDGLPVKLRKVLIEAVFLLKMMGLKKAISQSKHSHPSPIQPIKPQTLSSLGQIPQCVPTPVSYWNHSKKLDFSQMCPAERSSQCGSPQCAQRQHRWFLGSCTATPCSYLVWPWHGDNVTGRERTLMAVLIRHPGLQESKIAGGNQSNT